MIETLVSIILIAMTMATIVALYVRSAKILRASREVAAASQILQQRIEMVRDRSWSEVANAQNLARLMEAPADSEGELTNVDVSEVVTVTVPDSLQTEPAETGTHFSIRRQAGQVTIVEPGQLAAAPTLLVEGTVTWTDSSGPRERKLRTVICRMGLTRSGIVGTMLGRPGGRVSGGPR
jgi:Tfp pilus assembly protein PilV